MPGYKFLKNNEVLNKENLKEKASELVRLSKEKINRNPSQLKMKLEEFEIRGYKARLNHFFNVTKKALKSSDVILFTMKCGFNSKDIRYNHINYLKNILSTKCIDRTYEVEREIAFLNDKERSAPLNFPEIVNRIAPSVKNQYRHLLTTNPVETIGNSVFLKYFDDYIELVEKKLSNEQLKNIGDDVNNFITRYEYDPNNIQTEKTYDEKIEDSLNTLKETRMLGTKALSDEDIKEYEEALNYTNELMADPVTELEPLYSMKRELDQVIEADHTKDADERLKGMGYDMNPLVQNAGNQESGPYLEIAEGKKKVFDETRNKMEFEFSNESKKNIKEILHKMSELGFDQTNSINQRIDKTYGLKLLYDPLHNFRISGFGSRVEDNDEIANQNVNNTTRKNLRMAKFAKETMEADKKVTEVMDLIKNKMTVTKPENLAFPSGIDVLKDVRIPPKYRVDYPTVSVLATFSLISNMIRENGWDIDKFVDSPMKYIRGLFDEKLYDKLDPIKISENKTGADLIFELSRNILEREDDFIDKNADMALEGLALLDNNFNNRSNNYAKYKAFNNTVIRPYENMKTIKSKLANKNNLDKLIIKPDLPIESLGIRKYDAINLKMTEPGEDSFDDVSYLKLRTENISDFKQRIDREILKYINNEAKLVKETRSKEALTLDVSKYLSIVQKAVAKYLD